MQSPFHYCGKVRERKKMEDFAMSVRSCSYNSEEELLPYMHQGKGETENIMEWEEWLESEQLSKLLKK